MDIKDLLTFIRTVTLFSFYSDEDLGGLIEGLELKSVAAGNLVFDQGDAGDCFYIVYSGKIRIVQKNTDQKEINLGVRTRGDHFGETALITKHPRNAAARAVEDSVLLAMSNTFFENYLFARAELREYFDKFIRYTSIHRFLKLYTDLSVVIPQDIQKLVSHFNSEFFKEGELVFRQDATPDKFYLIESGKVKVERWEENRREIINYLREGEFFGEKALIEDSRRYADVVCLTDCHFFSLSREAFHELVHSSPKIEKVIRDRIEAYHSHKPPIPYQEIIKHELEGLKNIRIPENQPVEDHAPVPVKKNGSGRFSKLYRNVRFPFIMQYDEMTCGTTCIMMIAKYFGKTFSSSRLRDLAHVDLSGSSLSNLAAASEQLGFSTRGMRFDYEKLLTASIPCIVHWQGYHYVVVYRISDRHVWVADPAIGLRKYTREFFSTSWNGITLLLEPTPHFEQTAEDTSSIRNFLQFMVPHKLLFLEIFSASLLLNIFGLASPIFTQNIVDKVLMHHNTSMLNVMLIGMLIVLVFRIATTLVRQYLIIHTSMKIDLKMLVMFYKHMLALPLGYFKVRKIGDFITRFGENMKIRKFLTDTALTLLLDGLLIFVYLALMFYYNIQLTVLVLIFIPLFVAITLLFTPVLKRLNIDSFAAKSEADSHLIESINAIDTIKAMNIEYPVRWKWEDKFIKTLNIDFRLYTTGMYFHAFGDFFATLSSTVILWYGAQKVMTGALTVGELMAFMALMGSVITPINRIITSWDEIQQTLVSVDRLNDIFTAKPEFPQSIADTGIVVRDVRGEIVFDNVYFRFGGKDNPHILSNINVKIQPGETIAIVGRSGSGKTTLVKLLARFYDATDGRILVDGCDIKTMNLSNLRKTVGFVLQENFIFNGTIRENISLGDPEETMEKLFYAARLANAHDFISSLTLGYETRVGESGLQLSGGQKQRLAIARVLYANPRILVFDEATSALDTESEQAIQKNLTAILKDRTAIIIAHRLSTVRNADRILVLDNGEIVEQGNHEELMAQKGLYHYLNHQQLNL